MTAPGIDIRRIGAEARPLIVFDDFAANPDALRAAAAAQRFTAAAHYYPGIRAALPDDYWPAACARLAPALSAAFGPHRGVKLIDASFSIVTRKPAALTLAQRLPHVDAHAPDRIALVHHLSATGDGTAFFRHRGTGYEAVDEARAPAYRAALDAELRGGPHPAGYIFGDTSLFERIALGEARYNRALLYPSFLLHSGAIAPDAALSPDPAVGRLTITAFLELER